MIFSQPAPACSDTVYIFIYGIVYSLKIDAYVQNTESYISIRHRLETSIFVQNVRDTTRADERAL